MRLKSANFLVWLLLVPLILGLAGFGISDMLTGGITSGVAQIGDDEIGKDEFARAYVRALRAASQQAGRQLSAEEAREIGIDRITLLQLARQKALAAEAARLGLSVSDARIAEEIAKIEEFRGADGTFSIEQARYVLSQAGFTEKELREDTRARMTEALVEAAITRGIEPPRAVVEQILRFRNEERSLAFVKLDAASHADAPPAPSEEALVAWHAANAGAYTLPETRVVSYASLSAADLVPAIVVPEETLRAEYADRGSEYKIPERRNVARMTFPSVAEAAAAKGRIVAGEITLTALAMAAGFAEDTISLGDIAATSLSGPAQAAVFGMAAPGVTDPVETDLGVALFEVRAILAAREVPFEEARPDLQKALAMKDASDRLLEVATKVEDLVAGGARVEEVVKEAGFLPATLELPATGTLSGIAADAKFAEVARAAEPGREADLARTADGTYFVLRVDEVRPATLQPLDTVRERVAEDWTAAERLASVKAKAEALAAEVKGGATLAERAAALGLTVAEAGPVRRGATLDSLPGELVTALFAAPPAGIVTAADTAAAYVAQLGLVKPFDPAAPENAPLTEAVRDRMGEAYRNELFQSFVAGLDRHGPLRADPAAIEAVLASIR